MIEDRRLLLPSSSSAQHLQCWIVGAVSICKPKRLDLMPNRLHVVVVATSMWSIFPSTKKVFNAFSVPKITILSLSPSIAATNFSPEAVLHHSPGDVVCWHHLPGHLHAVFEGGFFLHLLLSVPKRTLVTFAVPLTEHAVIYYSQGTIKLYILVLSTNFLF